MNTLDDKTKMEAYKLYKNGMTSLEVSRQLCVSQWFVLNNLKRFGDSSRENAKKKYKVNESAFDNINTQESAYWLGFLYADGCNYIKRKYKLIRLALAEQDIIHLKKYKQFLFSTHPIQISVPKNINHQKMAAISIHSTKLSNALIKQGCIPNKTFLLNFPTKKQVSNDLIHHFIRGYFDGDGGISFRYNKRLDCHCYFTSTLNMCQEIRNILNKKQITSIIKQRHPKKDKNNYTLFIHGNRNALRLYKLLYNNANIYLDRKKFKFDLFTKIYADISL